MSAVDTQFVANPAMPGYDQRPKNAREQVEAICKAFSVSPPDILTKCAHCGTAIRYAAIMLHFPSNTACAIGEICLGNRFLLANSEFEEIRKAAKEQAKATKTVGKLEIFLRAHEDFRALMSQEMFYNSFVSDVLAKLEKNGELSVPQVEAVRRSITKHKELQAKRTEEAKTLNPAPTGRITFTGTILSLKTQEGYMGSIEHKMLLLAEGGYKVWTTVPQALRDAVKGQVITLTATLTPSNQDATFAIGKRPTLGKD
jgi:hypothetical protein